VLVLADQECLSDEKLDLIRSFVLKGGGLVATEQTSLKTEWGKRKRDFGLSDLLNVKAPELKELIYFDFVETRTKITTPVRNQAGNGRIVYIPGIVPSIQKPSGAEMTSTYWKLPVNNDELIKSVKWVSGDDIPIEVTAPPFVTMELTTSVKGDKMMLHLLNYKALRNEWVRNIKVALKIPSGKQLRDLHMFSPDRVGDIILPFEIKEGRVTFTVPDLEVYDLIAINLH